MLPSSAELIYFYEIANCLSMSKASLKLGISQPSLSFAIKRLEQTIGTSLFIRHKQGVSLLPAGKKLLAKVKFLLEQWDEIRVKALASHHEIQGEVFLGCPSPLGLYLHSFMGNLLESYPELSMHVQHDNSLTITQHVINSVIDIGIVTNPLQHPNLVIHKLNQTEITFWQGLDKKKIQDPKSNRTVIICDTSLPQTASLLKKWKKINSKLPRIININRFETIAHLTANNCGIGILPMCFSKLLYSNKLKLVPNSPSCFEEIYLIYRVENKNVKRVQMIVHTIKNLLKRNLN